MLKSLGCLCVCAGRTNTCVGGLKAQSRVFFGLGWENPRTTHCHEVGKELQDDARHARHLR